MRMDLRLHPVQVYPGEGIWSLRLPRLPASLSAKVWLDQDPRPAATSLKLTALLGARLQSSRQVVPIPTGTDLRAKGLASLLPEPTGSRPGRFQPEAVSARHGSRQP